MNLEARLERLETQNRRLRRGLAALALLLVPALTMGFALRHVADLRATFVECLRVLKPGHGLIIIEINRPESAWSYGIMKFYLKSVVPGLTRLTTSNRSAQSLMDYHWDTIDRCAPPETVGACYVRPPHVGQKGADGRLLRRDRDVDGAAFDELGI